MRALSATECITPAIERTKRILFAPFRKGRTWKLAATAYVSVMGSFFLPVPLAILALPWVPTPDKMGRGAFTLLFLFFVLFETAFIWLFFYFGARLQFVLFDIVLFKAEFVAPVWRKYKPQAWRWIGLKAAFGTAITLIAGIPLAAWSIHAFSRLAVQPGQPPPPGFVAGFLLTTFIVMGWFSLYLLVTSLLGDFVLPSLALESTSLSDAISRFMALLKAEPAQVFYFSCLKVVLAIAGFIALEIVVFIGEIAIGIPVGIVGFVGWLSLHNLGAAGALMMTAGGVILYLGVIAALFYLIIGLQGCLITFFQCYGMYFLGGRYPLLGSLLEPPPLRQPAPAPLLPDLPPPMPLESGAL